MHHLLGTLGFLFNRGTSDFGKIENLLFFSLEQGALESVDFFQLSATICLFCCLVVVVFVEIIFC